MGQFGIKTSSKAFKILSDGLYKNKIKAIIRELSTNAQDSHIEAGNYNPFDVELTDNTFSIRDYGTGISKDDLVNIYTNYFESTKINNMHVTGMLGLGSKVPFSYTDKFIVRSFYNGVVYNGVAEMIDGIPNFNIISEEETNESNGLEISIKLNTYYDKEKFLSVLTTIYKYFKIKPNIVGLGFKLEEEENPILKGDNWSYNLKPRYCYNDCAPIVVNSVSYPIDFMQIKNKNSYNIKRFITSHMTMFFNQKELDVTASREEISYDSQTIENINKVLNSSLNELNLQFQDIVNSSPSYYSAIKNLEKVLDFEFIDEFKLTYNNKNIDDIKTDMSNLKIKTISICDNIGILKTIYSTILFTTNPTIFFVDCNKSYKYSIQEYIKDKKNCQYFGEYIIIKDAEFIKKYFNEDEYIKLSDIYQDSPDTNNTINRKNDIKKITSISFDGDNINITKKEIDFTKPVYYTERYYGNINEKTKTALEIMDKFGFLDEKENLQIICVTSAELKLLQKKNNIYNFSELFKFQKEEIINKYVQLAKIAYLYHTNSNNGFVSEITDEALQKIINGISKNSPFSKIVSPFIISSKSIRFLGFSTREFFAFESYLESIFDISDLPKEIIEETNIDIRSEIDELYPLLNKIKTYNKYDYQDIIQYINMVDFINSDIKR